MILYNIGTIYLPNTQDGRKAMQLIRAAWRHKVLFVVGRNGVQVNGIPFKTKLKGGGDFGWNAAEREQYFPRLFSKLRVLGVTEDLLTPKERNYKFPESVK